MYVKVILINTHVCHLPGIGTVILEVGGKGRPISTPGKWVGVGRKGGGKGPGREEEGRIPGWSVAAIQCIRNNDMM